jgi:hypothetical protein
MVARQRQLSSIKDITHRACGAKEDKAYNNTAYGKAIISIR